MTKNEATIDFEKLKVLTDKLKSGVSEGDSLVMETARRTIDILLEEIKKEFFTTCEYNCDNGVISWRERDYFFDEETWFSKDCPSPIHSRGNR